MTFSSEFLNAFIDTLLPGTPATHDAPALPAGSQVGVAASFTTQLATHRDRETFARILNAIATQCGEANAFVRADEAQRIAAMQAVERAEGSAFQALVLLILADYYDSADVMRALGWRAAPPQPQGFTLPPFDASSLAQARQHGSLWRM
jgi:hypothetical protein